MSPSPHTDASAHQTPSAPRAARVLAVLVGLQGAGLILAGLVQTVQTFLAAHVMPVGAILLMSLLYIGYGGWLLAAARGVLAGRLWTRALILLTQVFLVLVSFQLVSRWSWPLAAALMLLGLVVVVLLFSAPVQHHLLVRSGMIAEGSDRRA